MQERPGLQDMVARPLAERMRPASLEDFFGQEDLLAPDTVLGKEIADGVISSMILWGPPGCGKTSLVSIIAGRTHAKMRVLSAVSAGVKEIREVLEASKINRLNGTRTILFIDEIHRLNKSQQDVLLADVERGNIILIGATTENPSFEINRALMSRCRLAVLHALSENEILALLKRALSRDLVLSALDITTEDGCLDLIAAASGGDARMALNCLESMIQFSRRKNRPIRLLTKDVKEFLKKRALVYDKSGEEHYNLISALHKSMRNSDPDAALYWLARILEAGEDPLYVARRLIRFASEDIGLVNNAAMQTAVAAYNAAHYIGMPECSLSLAQAVIYFSALPKSNSVYRAYEDAKKDALKTSWIPVPMHLRNAPTNLMKNLGYGRGYQYAHDYIDGITDMECLPEHLAGRSYYIPSDSGNERAVRERLEMISKSRKRSGEAD